MCNLQQLGIGGIFHQRNSIGGIAHSCKDKKSIRYKGQSRMATNAGPRAGYNNRVVTRWNRYWVVGLSRSRKGLARNVWYLERQVAGTASPPQKLYI